MAARAVPETFTAAAVQALLRTQEFGRRLHLLDQVDSTNRVCAAFAQQGEPHGTSVVAERQTAGRGRMGRSWFSPPREGLYCSVLVRPSDLNSDRLSWIPLVSALAAARAIKTAASIDVRLKWPNDLLHGERKLGGLLCEASSQPVSGVTSAAPPFVVIGIGINVNTPRGSFPRELQDIATSLAVASGGPVDRVQLLAVLLNELEYAWDSLRVSPITALMSEYGQWCATIGRHIRVDLPGDQRLEGVADSITAEGSLRVLLTGSGSRRLVEIRAGDVVHVRSTA